MKVDVHIAPLPLLLFLDEDIDNQPTKTKWSQ